MEAEYDYDYVVIGSGFGGSVAAMRLSQKGYRVAVIEAGKRWHADEFNKSNWNVRKSAWLPNAFCYGIQRMHLLKDVFVLAGAGVGGGSLNYANTLYVPPASFFEKESVKTLGGKEELLPYYELGKKMLGAAENKVFSEVDDLMKSVAAEYGKEDTFVATEVGVYFGEQETPAEDPYFFGEGPNRVGCAQCGECMTGCKKNAKNTLDKNYLYFAQKFGTEIIAENKVVNVRPLSADGAEGYELTTKKTTGLLGSLRGTKLKAKGVVFSAGVLGTMALMMDMKMKRMLPNLSDKLGRFVRTNSESIMFVRSDNEDADFTTGVAITSSVHPDENTHMEPVRYGKGHDMMATMCGVVSEDKKGCPRQLRAFFNMFLHPRAFFKATFCPVGFAKQTICLLVMQTLDNYINLQWKRRLCWPFKLSLTSTYGTDKKNPTWIPLAVDFARKLAKRVNGTAFNVTTENILNAPMTAHIMGGATVGLTGTDGVIDSESQVKGYKNMIVCDGAQIPENLGVNPSLSIVAFAERSMSFVQPKQGRVQHLRAEEEWGVKDILLQ
jgi:cholesterol oxidase